MSIGIEEIAIAGAVALGLLALIHAALALGLRMGHLVWGGRYPSVLPRALRLRSAAAAVLLGFGSWTLAAGAGVVAVAPVPSSWMRSAGWVVTALVGVGALGSFTSRSKGERYLMGSLAAIGAVAAGWWTFV